MTYDKKDFFPVEGEPNQWWQIFYDTIPNPDGEPVQIELSRSLFVGRDGQTLESLVAEFNAPQPELVPAVPDRVSRRQFRLQLIDDDLLDTVEGWIATQDIRTRAAYADSGTFVRTDEMLQAGFAALGFDAARVDGFFREASDL